MLCFLIFLYTRYTCSTTLLQGKAKNGKKPMYSSLAGYVNNVIFALIYSEVAAAIDETASLLYSCVHVHDINEYVPKASVC